MFTLLIIELIALFLIGAAAEANWDAPASFGTIIAVVLAFFLTSINPIEWVYLNINGILLGAVAWFVAGAAWSTFKWWRYTSSDDVQTQIKNEHASWKKHSTSIDGVFDPEKAGNFEDSSWFTSANVGKNKARLFRWIVWWPASLVWACTFRLVRWVGVKVYDVVKKIYIAITCAQVKRALSQ